jgi:signal transduction histidine kinase
MLYDFLLQNRDEILNMTERKSLELAGIRPSSEQLKRGLPLFYQQLITVLQREIEPIQTPVVNQADMVQAARQTNEPAMANASGHPEEAALARSAGSHGIELLRLGYSLSHVVHAYGAMCQSITELAISNDLAITAREFHDLNRCLDIAIAGAVTEYQSLRNTQDISREVEHLGFLAHELRNALTSVNVSLELIQKGTVGFGGSTSQVMKYGLKRIGELIDRSLTEVRLRIDPKVHTEPVLLLQLVDQIVVTAEVEARSRDQMLQIKIDPKLEFEADQQLVYSALSNLIQNALKFTKRGGRVQVRGNSVGEKIVIEVEDECGGLSGKAEDLFQPYVQENENRSGIGLGLTIAQRAIALIRGKIDVTNLPGKGCIFTIILPKIIGQSEQEVKPAA